MKERERERECVCVCVCVKERVKERESVCVCACAFPFLTRTYNAHPYASIPISVISVASVFIGPAGTTACV